MEAELNSNWVGLDNNYGFDMPGCGLLLIKFDSFFMRKAGISVFVDSG